MGRRVQTHEGPPDDERQGNAKEGAESKEIQTAHTPGYDEGQDYQERQNGHEDYLHIAQPWA